MARYRRFDVPLESTTNTVALPPELADVRLRRAGLKSAMSELELALAAPAPNRTDWLSRLAESLRAVHEVWTRHICETEAPGAFLDEVVSDAPRLSTPASRLRREHSDILAMIVRAEKRIHEPPDDDESYLGWADETRTELTTVLSSLARHRQRGADLVYEAYDVDLGGGF